MFVVGEGDWDALCNLIARKEVLGDTSLSVDDVLEGMGILQRSELWRCNDNMTMEAYDLSLDYLHKLKDPKRTAYPFFYISDEPTVLSEDACQKAATHFDHEIIEHFGAGNLQQVISLFKIPFTYEALVDGLILIYVMGLLSGRIPQDAGGYIDMLKIA